MKRHRIGKLVLLLGCLFFLIGCRDRIYDGDYPELFSVAIHSLLGARGFDSRPEEPAWIRVLEGDNYGRRLFLYDEGRIGGHLIIQKYEDGFVYFYPHDNFVLYYLTEEVEATLKEANSWNQPMSDSSEFERIPIVRQKEDGPIPNSERNKAHSELFPDANLRNAGARMNFLRMDRYGRSVYLATRQVGAIIPPPFAVIFQPDHSFDLETGVLEITDMNNYQTELRLFMEANGWNEPWDE